MFTGVYLLHIDASLLRAAWHGLHSCDSLLQGGTESVTPSQESSHGLALTLYSRLCLIFLEVIKQNTLNLIRLKCNLHVVQTMKDYIILQGFLWL